MGFLVTCLSAGQFFDKGTIAREEYILNKLVKRIVLPREDLPISLSKRLLALTGSYRVVGLKKRMVTDPWKNPTLS
jgi:hypothetical protein